MSETLASSTATPLNLTKPRKEDNNNQVVVLTTFYHENFDGERSGFLFLDRLTG